jgi:hypothetical protein
MVECEGDLWQVMTDVFYGCVPPISELKLDQLG